MSVMDKMLDRVSFWRHPITYLYQLVLVTLIGGRPVVVNVTIDTDSPGPLIYWTRSTKPPVVYNINLKPKLRSAKYPNNPFITSNPE